MVCGGRGGRAGADASFPVVLGCVRSGTTMLRAVLDSHPRLAVPPESYFVTPALEQRARYEAAAGGRARPRPAARRHRGRPLVPRLAARPRGARRGARAAAARPCPTALLALYRAYAHQQGKPRAGDKTPSHLLHIDLLAASFPQARFVHIVRDGRDVVPSILGMQFGPDRFAEAVLFWQRRVEQGLAGGAALGPERYREIRYEALVADPEAGAPRRVCPFLGLEYSAEMLRYHERADELLGGLRATRHVQGVRRPPTQGVRDWRTALAPPRRAAVRGARRRPARRARLRAVGAPDPEPGARRGRARSGSRTGSTGGTLHVPHPRRRASCTAGRRRSPRAV